MGATPFGTCPPWCTVSVPDQHDSGTASGDVLRLYVSHEVGRFVINETDSVFIAVTHFSDGAQTVEVDLDRLDELMHSAAELRALASAAEQAALWLEAQQQ